MKKFQSLLLAVAVATSFVLTACGTSPSSQSTPASAQPYTEAVKSGAKKMRTELVELSKALEDEDAVKAKQYGEELHEIWEKFEDEARAANKSLYEKIEEPLGVIRAGVKVSPLDKAVLGEQIKKLDGLLGELVKSARQ